MARKSLSLQVIDHLGKIERSLQRVEPLLEPIAGAIIAAVLDEVTDLVKLVEAEMALRTPYSKLQRQAATDLGKVEDLQAVIKPTRPAVAAKRTRKTA